MILSTTEHIPGKKVKQIKGIAKGSTIRAKHLGRDIAAGLKSLVGGELKGYTEMINEAREESLSRMKADADKMGAHAIINIRFVTAEVMPGAAEILVYGTAVTLE